MCRSTKTKRLMQRRWAPFVALGAATLAFSAWGCGSDDEPGEAKGGTSGAGGGASGKGGSSGGSAGSGATGGGGGASGSAGAGVGGSAGAGVGGSAGAGVGGSAGSATGGSSGADGGGKAGSAGVAGSGGTGTDGGRTCTPYPAGPYGNQVGQTFPNLTWEGYVNDTADAVSTTKPFRSYSSTELCTSGRSFALVHLSEYF